VIALLGLVLVAAIALVVWLAMRPDAPQRGAPKAPVKTHAPETPAMPHAPRPKTDETLPIASEIPSAGGGVPKAPPESEERETVKLDVLVLGSNGQPAPGATVLLLDPFAQHAGTPRPAELARAKADDAGHAKFETSQRMLRAYAWLANEAGASDKFRPSDAKADVVVHLSLGIAAHGRVVETGGEPVPDAAVRFLAASWYGDAFGLLLETKSGADGTFDLPPLPSAAFDEQSSAFALEARAKGWSMTRIFVTADTLRAGEVVVTLERGGFLRGRFVRPTGDAVGGEEARLTDGRSSVVSAQDGKFELPLPRGGGIVLAVQTPGDGHHDTYSRAGGGYGAPKLLGRFRGDGGDIDLGDVTLSPGQPVKGVVVYSDEKPVPAGDVVLYLAGVPVAQTQTDDAGKFQIDAIGDDSHLLVATEAAGENAWSGRRHASADGVKGGGADVRIVITGALTVVVKFQSAADNSPVVVPEVKVRMDAVGATPRRYGWSYAGAHIENVRLEAEYAGRYTATFEIPGYDPASSDPFDLTTDGEVRITVLFRKQP